MTRFFALIFSFLMFSVVLACPAKADNALSVNSLRIGTHPDSTRIVLELSRSSDFRAFLLQDPPRIVIDLPTFDWKAGGISPPPGSLVQTIRNGPLRPGISRIVVEVSKQVSLKSAFILPAGAGNSDRLVIDFIKAPEGFDASKERVFGNLGSDGPKLQLAPLAQKAEPKAIAPKVNGDDGPRTLQLPPKYRTDPLPYDAPPEKEAAYPPKAVAVKDGDKILIVIDAGHGGEDPGALGSNGAQEKNVTLAAAKQVKENLEATGRYKVHLTRSTDVFIKLQDRVKIARKLGADLFISLHADSIDKPNVSGASIYTLSNKASDDQTAKLAARENRADLIAGVDLSHEDKEVANILIDLAMRDTMNQSKYFANAFVKQAGREGMVMLEKPHRFAGFAVLKAPDIPSVLIEMGFMSNDREVSQLSTPEYRDKIASAIVAGVNGYFAKVRKKAQN